MGPADAPSMAGGSYTAGTFMKCVLMLIIHLIGFFIAVGIYHLCNAIPGWLRDLKRWTDGY